MPRFFVPCENVSDGEITISADDSKHIALSLRMAVGENITVCDYSSKEYDCTLKSIAPSRVVCTINSVRPSSNEPPYHVRLYQAMPKSDKMDVIVQKSVECGACEIVPFISERCISRPDRKALEKKSERWNKIAANAASQCGRGIIPKVCETVDFSCLIKGGERKDGDADILRLFFYEGDGTVPLPKVLSEQKLPEIIDIVVGAEGGFSMEEAEKLVGCGYIPCGLGRRILRCESAAPFALACISYAFEL